MTAFDDRHNASNDGKSRLQGMVRGRGKGALTAVLLLLGACNQQSETVQQPVDTDTSPVIARVADTVIHESELNREMRAMPESLQQLATDPAARKQILQVMIRRAVLSRKAMEVGLNTDPLVRERIEKARDDILIDALQEWQSSRLPEPSEEEIQTYYKKHLAEFTIPEQIHARHILVRSEDEANDIRKQLKRKNADFAALAARYSVDDSNKSRGGDLNWFPRGVMVPEFEKAAFALKEAGDISAPVHTRFGWHVIELLGKRPASRRDLDSAREEIVQILKEKALTRWIDSMVNEADTEILKPEYRPDE
jgi:peptidyl-prolyl cis-trans isomerase C